MSKIDLAYDLTNYTPADASPVEANFNRVEQHINQEVIEREGTVAMTAQLKLVGNPVSALDAAPKQYVDLLLPIGIVLPYSGVTVPGARWALANGALLEIAAYPDLYAAIGTTWNDKPPAAPTPAGSFRLPNLMDKMPIGASATKPAGTAGGSANAVVVDHRHNANHAHTASADSRDLNHYHSLSNHTHSVGLYTDERGSHGHGMGHGALLFVQQDGGWSAGTGDGGSGYALYPHYLDGAHQHAINGTSGGPNVNTTNWWSENAEQYVKDRATHNHTVTVNANNFDTTNQIGASNTGVDQNLPPYLAIQWIVRVM